MSLLIRAYWVVDMATKGDVIGVFIGLESATYEYIATIIAPYQSNFSIRVGDFLLIDNTTDYLVSRIKY